MALKYEDIKKEFQDVVNKDKEAQKLYAQIRKGDASYATSGKLAQRIGADLGKVLMKHAPINSIDEWDVDDLIPKALGLDHRMVVTACKQVQENMNKDAKVGIKYKEPKFNMDKAQGIVKELKDNPEFTNIEKTFYDQLENFSRSVADDSIVANAGVMWKAGIKTIVVRTAEADCCKWCSEMAGTYNYADVKEPGNDVWRRHENCNCTIDFYTERNGEVQRERVKEGIERLSDEQNNATSQSPFEDTTKSWLEEIPKGNIEVFKGDVPVDKNGNPYEDSDLKIRSKNRNEEEDIKIANLISERIESEIEMIPEVDEPKNRPTPDFRIVRTNETMELKTVKLKPDGSDVSEKAIERCAKRAEKQSSFVIVDITNYPYDRLIESQIKAVFKNESTLFVKKLMLVKDGKIIGVYKRK